jgi:general secretion pathway protein A
MYEAFYGLRDRPFSILPDPDLIFWGQNHRLAFTMLEFGVMHSAGFTVITGEIGSGKTTLLRYLMARLDPKFTVGLITNTPRGTDGLLSWVMMSLNLPFEGSYPRLFRTFQQFLRDEYRRGHRVILIVDEAQNLGLETLEELRMLSNINADKNLFLQIILVGQPQLRDMLRTPQLVQFAQRVSSAFHLRPLNPQEVSQYIDYRLEAVGSRDKLFSRPASDLIAKASRGIPRTINILCDTALVYGFANDTRVINEDLVAMVIEDKERYGVVPIAAASAS